MSLNVGELVAYLRMDDSDFKKKADSGEKRFSGLASSLATGAKVVGAAGVGAVAAAGMVGVRTAAQMENATIGFTTMLGSAQKADAFINQMKSFAAATPFEFAGLQTAASSLISIGIDSSKVIPIMTTLGNVTSGMGTGAEGIQRATVALQQMNAAGKIQAQDLNQLRDAGIPVYDLLASAMGKPKAEVAALAQNGKLGKDALDKMMSALETGKGLERFNGLMDAQSQSLNGLWSTLHDTFTMGMGTAIAPLVPLIKDGLGGSIAYLTGLMPRIAAGLQGMVGGIKQFADGWSVLNGADPEGHLGRIGQMGVRVHVALAQARDVVREFAAGWSVLNGADPAGQLGKVGQAGIRVHLALLQARDAVKGLFPAKGTGDGIDWAATLDKVQMAASQLWPMFVQTAESLKGLHPIISVSGAVFGVLADHIDLIVQVMPLLLAAFVAYKAAQTAAMIAEIVHLPVTLALAASNIAYANAVWALLAANGIQRTSMLANTIAWVKNTAAVIASGVATAATTVWAWAQAAATRAVTAAQWLWNAALTANPIGLVIVAIGLLVGGLILLYQHSETARRIMDAAFHGIADAASYMWNDVIKPYFRFMAEAWLTVVGTILDGAAKAFGWVPVIGDKLKGAAKAFDGFRDDVNNALDGVKDKTITVEARASMITADRALGSVAGNLNPNVNGKAAGGPIVGPGSGTSDTAGLFPLSNGEHVLTASDVQKAGGHGAIYAMRASIQKGMATGGAVGLNVNAQANATPITSGLGSWYDSVINAVTSAAQTAANAAATASAAASSTGGGSTNIGSYSGQAGHLDPATARAAALAMLPAGWSMAALTQLWNGESGWRWNADNPSSSAYGIPQALPGSKMGASGSDWHDNAITQIKWGLGYIGQVYGNPQNALSKWQARSPHWYDTGGLAVGAGLMAKGPTKERVLSGRQTEAFERLVDMLDRGGMGGQPAVHIDQLVTKDDAPTIARAIETRFRDAQAVFG